MVKNWKGTKVEEEGKSRCSLYRSVTVSEHGNGFASCLPPGYTHRTRALNVCLILQCQEQVTLFIHCDFRWGNSAGS